MDVYLNGSSQEVINFYEVLAKLDLCDYVFAHFIGVPAPILVDVDW